MELELLLFGHQILMCWSQEEIDIDIWFKTCTKRDT